MKLLVGICLIPLGLLAGCQGVSAAPPFSGTIFLDPDIITPADRTTFQGVSYLGQGFRWMFDRRVNDWTYVNAYLFDASFDDGIDSEIQVNPEFGSFSAARAEAQKYGPIIGRLPTALRIDVDTVLIHQGTEPFGGGNNNLLIHTGQADLYTADGILEKTLVHEATHTSLDADHATAPAWLAAQTADGEYISTYVGIILRARTLPRAFCRIWRSAIARIGSLNRLLIQFCKRFRNESNTSTCKRST